MGKEGILYYGKITHCNRGFRVPISHVTVQMNISQFSRFVQDYAMIVSKNYPKYIFNRFHFISCD